MPATAPIILQSFDESPFSEKVRIVFGLKNITGLRPHHADHAAPRSDADDRRSAYACHARSAPTSIATPSASCATGAAFFLNRPIPIGSKAWPGNGDVDDRSFFQHCDLVFGTLADKSRRNSSRP